MTVYDYKCVCGKKFEASNAVKDRRTSLCPACGKVSKMVFSIQKNISIFRPYWDPNISSEPVLVRSKNHKKALLKENGLVEVG